MMCTAVIGGVLRGQEVVLAVRLTRTFFDSLLENAVASSFDPTLFVSHEKWKEAVAMSDTCGFNGTQTIDPISAKGKNRRAIQLGLRAEVLNAYARREIIEIVDMSEFVASQAASTR